ncbi:MAG: cobalamin-binding protein [Pseudomonadota bacterium]
MRVISLLPSATEIICSVGGEAYLVGVTHECDYPAGINDLPVVTESIVPKGMASKDIDQLVSDHLTGTNALYSLDESMVQALKPDLIVSQSLCEVCAVAANEIEHVALDLDPVPQVINLEPSSLGDVFQTMRQVGNAIGHTDAARETVDKLQARVDAVKQASNQIATTHKQSVAVLEWLDPLFSSGHWTPELVQLAGGVEATGNIFQPSTRLSWEALHHADPDIIVIALCGFDVDRSRLDLALVEPRLEWRSLRAVRNNNIHVVDGNAYFSRPGPRLVDSLELVADILRR